VRALGPWLVVAGMVVAAASCTSGEQGPALPPVHDDDPSPPSSTDAGTAQPVDAGDLPDAGGADAGEADGGVSDGGADGGEDKVVVLPSAAGWTFFGPQHGGPKEVLGASLDEGGNLWVAGGEEGLFLLSAGSDRLQRFTVADGLTGYTDASGVRGFPVISVAGGPAGVAFVGYRGLEAGQDENDPPYMVKSGDADKVERVPGGIRVTHFDISTPPGVSSTYPNGRDKIRHVFRIVYDAAKGDVWFGGNHGIAVWSQRFQKVLEHEHAAINGYRLSAQEDPSGSSYTLLSGDWYGLTRSAAGDIWFGGGHRTSKLAEGNFYASHDPVLDVWPDAVASNARPEQRVDDYVQDLAIMGETLWVGSILNGLAKVGPEGVGYVPGSALVDPKVTALEADPADGSLWVGHIYGGLTRLKDGAYHHFDYRVLGEELIAGTVPDIQSAVVGGQRRLVVSFQAGAVGIYTGP
jgi:hypothetical protein